MHYYTVYDRKTDEILASGTARECAYALDMTMGSFYTAIARTRNGERQRYRFLIENIDPYTRETIDTNEEIV